MAKLYGGLIDDLCNQDWGKMLGSLAKAIIPQPLPINRNFDLMGMAKLGDILKVRVNGRELSNSEYSFDDASDTIRIGSSVALHDGEQIEVEYYK